MRKIKIQQHYDTSNEELIISAEEADCIFLAVDHNWPMTNATEHDLKGVNEALKITAAVNERLQEDEYTKT